MGVELVDRDPEQPRRLLAIVPGATAPALLKRSQERLAEQVERELRIAGPPREEADQLPGVPVV